MAYHDAHRPTQQQTPRTPWACEGSLVLTLAIAVDAITR